MDFKSTDEFKKKSGIYCILNTVNGKFYIGSTTNLWRRYKNHFNDLSKNQHHSVYLQRAFNKYGNEAFEFHVLEVVEKEEGIYLIEQKYLDFLKPYNRQIGYNVENHVSIRSKETIAKIVATRKANGNSEKFQKHLDSLSEKKKGVKLSPETKAKISISQKNKTRSESHKKNNGLAIRKPIIEYDWLGYPVNYFDSLLTAANHFGIKSSTLTADYIKKDRPHKEESYLVYLTKN